MPTTKKKKASKSNIRFGEHLRSVRNVKGLSLRTLADNCKMDNSNISKIENGKLDVQLSTIIELSRGLGVHPSELLNYEFD